MFFGITLGLCACGPRPAQAPHASDLVASARVFMADYARDLRAGDRDAIAARYDPRGVYFDMRGKMTLFVMDSVRAMYHGPWRPPTSFEWHDLAFEPAGSGAMVVTGRFDWGGANGRIIPMRYAALLCRQAGTWRIRVEDESETPKPPAPTFCAGSAAEGSVPPARR